MNIATGIVACVLLATSPAPQQERESNGAASTSRPARAKPLAFSDATEPKGATFLRSAPGDDYLKRLRTQFELDVVVAGEKSDYGRVRAICEWARHRWEHNGDNQPEKSDPISILEEAAAEGKRFRCVEYAIVVDGALESLGIRARVLGLKTADVETRERGAGHVVAEAYLADKKKWVMIDGQFDVIPTLGGEPLNAVELQRALAKDARGLGVVTRSDADADTYFAWVAPYLFYFDTTFDGRFGVERAPGKLMLVPIGAKDPTVFQRKWPIGDVTYTHSVATFYAAP